jgi:hypothetical protein
MKSNSCNFNLPISCQCFVFNVVPLESVWENQVQADAARLGLKSILVFAIRNQRGQANTVNIAIVNSTGADTCRPTICRGAPGNYRLL